MDPIDLLIAHIRYSTPLPSFLDIPLRQKTSTMSVPLDRQKSPTVQHLQSYDRAMCEATLGTTPSSSSSPSSSSNSKSNSDSSAPPPPFHTNPTKPGGVKSKLSLGLGLGFGKTKSKSNESEGAAQTGQEAEGYPESKLVKAAGSNTQSPSDSHPTSPGALISQPPKDRPSHNQNNPVSISQAHPDDIKKSLTTFEDPLGLGLETLPTTEHADKMVKKGERKIRLGSLLHSGKLVSRITSLYKSFKAYYVRGLGRALKADRWDFRR
ncbi:hypothetical protein HD553DRAFT_326039 [Filobasidium floriforme]|uniref:uncharacterized protein n=1 Tax=Filobasidium floriforme TaxID=5210 RepID=UPI001E8EB054|nr:uncharacterized protein HD553DRAFT_326039 [Filobasidium floriforme]KAH8080655.1 hypothetical protein HD553DRAFT_326039 [Filobasidium floriforme]